MTRDSRPKAVGYIRVSTVDQAQEGVSLDSQRQRIERWAEIHEYNLVGFQVDAGLSGSRADNRPGLQLAIEQTCRNKAALIVFSMSRLGRSTSDVLSIAARLEKAGADLVSLSEKVDTTSAAGKMIFRLLAVLSEFERDLIVERTTAAMAHLRHQGRRISRFAPYGYAFSSDGSWLLPDPVEQAIIVSILELRGAGMSFSGIARHLNDNGVNTKQARRWHAKTIRDVCHRAGREDRPDEGSHRRLVA